jgi:hypothetical protein
VQFPITQNDDILFTMFERLSNLEFRGDFSLKINNLLRFSRQGRLAGLVLAELLVLSLFIFSQTPAPAQAYGGRTPGVRPARP